MTAGLAGLGQEFEDAARVHGAGRLAALRLILPILAPAIWSALAINFAESVSDFGVAATLAYSSNFPLATYQLYASINNFPPSFPAAAAMGWLLVAAVALPLALHSRHHWSAVAIIVESLQPAGECRSVWLTTTGGRCAPTR